MLLHWFKIFSLLVHLLSQSPWLFSLITVLKQKEPKAWQEISDVTAQGQNVTVADPHLPRFWWHYSAVSGQPVCAWCLTEQSPIPSHLETFRSFLGLLCLSVLELIFLALTCLCMGCHVLGFGPELYELARDCHLQCLGFALWLFAIYFSRPVSRYTLLSYELFEGPDCVIFIL